MMLQIDCGNTRIKWRVLSQGIVVERGAELVLSLDVECLCLHFAGLKVSRAIISSVNHSPNMDRLVEALGRLCGESNIVELEHGHFIGQSQFAYTDVTKLGLDRCLVIMAARALAEEGSLIIDCGSAMTADFVLPGGEHLGGYIFPGYNMLFDSLLGGTSKINLSDDVSMSLMPGACTDACVINGVGVMLSQTLKYLTDLSLSYGVTRVFVTGGDAERAMSNLSGECQVRKDMVFEGVDLIADSVFKRGGEK